MVLKDELRILITGDNSVFKKALKGAEGAMDKFSATAVKVGSAASKAAFAAGAAGVAGAGLSVKAFADFDKAMTESLAIMGDVAPELQKKMEATARSIAKETTFSAKQAAESYFFLASAGLNAEQSIAALPQVSKFAQAGAFDMATATDLLTDAQSALGLVVSDTTENLTNMSRVGDVLVKANTLANASVEQFAEALTNEAGAALKNFNIPLEEGVALLAAYADQGIKGNVAGSTLARTLRLIGPAAKENAEAFESMGIEVFDAEGEFRNMADIIRDMEGALNHLSTAEKQAALEQLGFQARVQQAILPLLGTSDAIRKYEAGLREAGGITQEVAEKQLTSFSAQMALAKSRMQDVALTVGGAIAPAILTAVDALEPVASQLAPAVGMIGEQFAAGLTVVAPLLTSLVGKFSALTAEGSVVRDVLTSTFMGIRDALQAALNGVKDVLSAIAEGFNQFTPDVQGWKDAIVSSIGIVKGTIEGVKPILEGLGFVLGAVFGFFAENPKLAMTILGVAAAMKVLSIAMTANPIGIVIVAIGALIGALGYLIKEKEKVAKVTKKVWRKVERPVEKAVRFMTRLFLNFTPLGLIIKHWAAIKRVTVEAWESVTAFLKKHWQVILAVVLGPLGVLVGLVIKHWDTLKDKTSDAWGRIKDGIASAWDAIQRPFRTGFDVLRKVWAVTQLAATTAWTKLKDGVLAIWDSLKAKLEKPFEFLKNIGTTVKDTVVSGLKAIINSIVDVINSGIKLLNKGLPKRLEIPLLPKWDEQAVQQLPSHIPPVPVVAAVAPAQPVSALTGGGSPTGRSKGSGGGSGRSRSSGRGTSTSTSTSTRTASAAAKTVARITTTLAKVSAKTKSVAKKVTSSAKKAWGSVKKFFRFDDPSNDRMAFRWGKDFGDFWQGGLSASMEKMNNFQFGSPQVNLGGAPSGQSVSVQVGGIHVHLAPGEGNAAGVKRGVTRALSDAERRWAAQVF